MNTPRYASFAFDTYKIPDLAIECSIANNNPTSI